MNTYSKNLAQKQVSRVGQDMAIVETILSNRKQFFAEIGGGIGLREKIEVMLVTTIAFLTLYGALLGSTHSLLQTLSSAVKLPLLFLASLMICAPALYMLNILFDLKQSLLQSIALVLTAITVMVLLLLSFAPITLFFVMAVADQYQFFKLLNLFFFAIAGGVGAAFLKQGMQVIARSGQDETHRYRLPFYGWALIYIFVGSQMAWTLRPFFGYPEAPFELVRQVGGNFYTDIFASFGEILGFLIVK